MKNQTAFFVFNLIVVLLSFLIGLRVLPGPEWAGMVLSFYSLLVLPGILVLRLFSSGISISIRGICKVFLTGVAMIILLISTGFISGADLGVIRILANVLVVLLLAAVFFRSKADLGRDSRAGGNMTKGYRRSSRINPWRIIPFIVLFLIFFIIFFESGNISSHEDSLDHISFVSKCLESGEILPMNSFYRGGDGAKLDPRKGLWHPAMALIALQGDVTAEYLWRMMPALLSFFAIMAFMLFALELLDSPTLAYIAAVLLLFFGRGDGLAWLTKISYSRHFVQLILWGQVGFLLSYIKGDYGKVDLIFMFLAAFAGTAVHAVFPLLLFATLLGFFFYTAFPWGQALRSRLWRFSAVMAAGVAVPLIVRFAMTAGEFNYIHTHEQGLLRLTESLVVVDPIEIVNSMGMAALFGIVLLPVYFAATGRRREFKLVEILYVVPVMLAVIPLVSSVMERIFGYLHYRILFAAPLMCFLSFAITDSVAIIFTGRSRLNYRRVSTGAGIAKRAAALVWLALFIYYPLRFQWNLLPQTSSGILKGPGGESGKYEEMFEEIEGNIPGGSVILSDPLTSYYLSGLTNHYVCVVPAQHESPSDLQALDRNRQAREFFCSSHQGPEDLAWLCEEHADYVLIDKKPSEESDFYGISGCACMQKTVSWLRKNTAFPVILERDGFVLFGIDQSGIGHLRIRPLTAGKDSIGDNTVPEEKGMKVSVGEGVTLRGFSLDNEIFTAGDTLRGSAWMSLREKHQFGLPLILTIRLDTDFPKGAFYRPWYGKQYRRKIEKDNNTLYRFTFSDFLKSGCSYPEDWKIGEVVIQRFSFVIPVRMAEGAYDIRIAVRQKRYLPVRTMADYLRNADSKHGEIAGSVFIMGS